jgi:hypothetical protein
VKDYPELRENLMIMLQELEASLDKIVNEEKHFKNPVSKIQLEIEKALLSDQRFKTKKNN